MTARDTRRGGVARYRVHPTAATIPLSVAGLYAVYVPVGQETRIYYCEPTGRCSCGAPSGSCPHIATAAQCAATQLSTATHRRRRVA